MRQLLILMLCLTTISVRAQKISHNFQDISLSDALRYIQEQTTQSEIFFIYNDLEDFRVTANVRSKSVPDAIRQIIGFYPIRVYNNGDREIYVECTHKTDFRLTGIIVELCFHLRIPQFSAVVSPMKAVTLLSPVNSPKSWPASHT